MFHSHHLGYLLLLLERWVFLTLLFLFVRVLPAISIFEMRELVHKEAPNGSMMTEKGPGTDLAIRRNRCGLVQAMRRTMDQPQ